MDCCKRLKHDADATISSLISHMNSKIKPKQPQQRETKSIVAAPSKPEQQNTDALLELQKHFEAEQNRSKQTHSPVLTEFTCITNAYHSRQRDSYHPTPTNADAQSCF